MTKVAMTNKGPSQAAICVLRLAIHDDILTPKIVTKDLNAPPCRSVRRKARMTLQMTRHIEVILSPPRMDVRRLE